MGGRCSGWRGGGRGVAARVMGRRRREGEGRVIGRGEVGRGGDQREIGRG